MESPIALVTGGVRGIGLEIVKGLADKGIVTVFTSTSKRRGQQLEQKLQQQGLRVFHQELNVSKQDSIAQLVARVKQQFGGLDILINNAGVFGGNVPDLLNLQRAKWIINVNYYGAKALVEALLPVMRPGARIINVSSAAARFDAVSNDWTDKLLDTENLTVATIDCFIEDFYHALSKDELEKRGFPPHDAADYVISKMALAAYTALLAKQLKGKVTANAMCPGFNSTDMSYKNGQPPELGADTAIWLATLPASSCPSGKFFASRHEVPNWREIPLVSKGVWYWTPEQAGGVLGAVAAGKEELMRRHARL